MVYIMRRQKTKLSNYHLLVVGTFILLIYIIYIVSVYAKKTKIYSYQVKAGTLTETSIYTGFAIRDEEIIKSNDTGYIDYFAREGEHVGVGDMVYTIDESGSLSELINDNQGENSLSKADLNVLKNEISSFSSTFDERNYAKTYDFLYSIDGSVLKLANLNILNKLQSVNSKSISDLVKIGNAPKAGYIVYNIDGYETVSSNSINNSLFDKSKYDKNNLIGNDLVDNGQDVYKLIKSEDWDIVIKVTEAKAKELQEEGYIQVRFLEDQRTTWAGVTIHEDKGDYFAILSFNNSVMAYCTERYIEIELLNTEKTGLKIPVSSIVHKEFFLIPADYAIDKGEENKYSFLKKKFNEDGTVSAELVETEVYALIDDYYYVDDSAFRIGDYLIKQNSQDTTPVSTKGELVGVYNMNKGYADFRQIIILYQNEEYAIVKSNTAYGLNEYDYIVLDSSSVVENDILY